MTKLTTLFGFALVLTSANLLADGTITGPAARRIWNELPGPVAGPYCTGACLPGHPCDPACFSNKEGLHWRCTRAEYLRSHRVEYECTRHR